MGAYHIYFKEWLKVFPRDQILVIKFEDYARNRSGIMAKITDFLELGKYLSCMYAYIFAHNSRNIFTMV